MYKKIVNKKVILIIVLLVTPWFNSDLGFIGSADIVRQEDISFYEINPCKVSLTNFIFSNPNSIYQDHYNFKLDNKSSILCYGRITGVTIIDNNFFISVGSNTLISLIFQSFIWILILSFLSKDTDITFRFSSKKLYYFALVLTTLFYTFTVFSENRFYSNNIYSFSKEEKILQLLVFFIFLLILKNLIKEFHFRSKKIINFIPIIFLFQGIATGANISIFISIFIFIGIYSKLENPRLNFKEKLYFLITFFWTINSSKNYYFEPGKLRGFTNSFYDVKTTLLWSLIFYFVVIGLYYYCKNFYIYFNFNKFLRVYTFVCISLLPLGLIGSNFPIFNFLNYYLFGTQKAGITRNFPISINAWGEIVSWRGFYTSAETIGEFYGLLIILLIYWFTKNRYFDMFYVLGFIVSLVSLIFSDNRTSIILAIVFLTYFFIESNKFKKIGYFAVLLISLSSILYFFGIQNFTYELTFIKSKLFLTAFSFSYGLESSSALKAIENLETLPVLLKFFLDILGIFSYFLNRTEMWGLFLARYNPTFFELMVGSGPLNFGQLYGEMYINEPDTFLLPHSSILSYILFFGIVGLFVLYGYLIFYLYKNIKRISYLGLYVVIFIMINILKNDSLNYFPNFLMYTFLILIILNFDNFKLFSFNKITIESNKNNT